VRRWAVLGQVVTRLQRDRDAAHPVDGAGDDGRRRAVDVDVLLVPVADDVALPVVELVADGRRAAAQADRLTYLEGVLPQRAVGRDGGLHEVRARRRRTRDLGAVGGDEGDLGLD